MPQKQSYKRRKRKVLKPKLKMNPITKKSQTITKKSKTVTKSNKTVTKSNKIVDGKYYVYLMTNGIEYKIGITNNPERRLKQCQTGNPKQLSYVCVVERPNKASAIFLEKSIHHGLKQHRLQGEWFKLNHQSLSIVIKELHPLPI